MRKDLDFFLGVGYASGNKLWLDVALKLIVGSSVMETAENENHFGIFLNYLPCFKAPWKAEEEVMFDILFLG